jgi:hypothetical protein
MLLARPQPAIPDLANIAHVQVVTFIHNLDAPS